MAQEHCPNIERCELFPKIKLESSLTFCIEVYCRGDFTRCARYQHVKATKTKPPLELLPNGRRLTIVDD